MAKSTLRPVAQGTLEDKPLVHVFVYLDKNEMTGTLTIFSDSVAPERQNEQDRIYFEKGRPVAAHLTHEADSLEQGLLPLFDLRRSPFGFYQVDLVSGSNRKLRGEVDPLALVTRSLRQTAREDAVQEVLRRIGSSTLRLAPEASLKRFQFEPKERALVELLQAKPTDAETLIRNTDLPRQRAERLIYLLAITKSIVIDSSMTAGPDAPGDDPGRREPVEDRRRQVEPAPTRPARGEPLAAFARAPSGPPPPPDLTPELTMRWMEIVNLSNDIDNQTCFALLGVDRQAEPAQVKSAYFELAKRWHPDRLPPGLLPLKDRVQLVFHHMSRAHDHLTDPRKRIEYLKSLDEGGGTPAADRELKRKLDAAMEFMKVDVLRKRLRFDQALELLDEILQVDDQEPTYHATRALILMNKHPGKDAPFAEMLRSINRALELDSGYEDAYFYRGHIHRRMGHQEEALADFNRVLDINPKNIAAQREVRVDRIRRTSSEGRRVSNLVSLVFGKKDK